MSSFSTHPAAHSVSSLDELDSTAPHRWLALGVQDFRRAPAISLLYGAAFAILPAVILFGVLRADSYLVILPAIVACALIGPAFASGLYAVAAQLEKNGHASLKTSWQVMRRSVAGEWGFSVILMLVMLLWLRVAMLVHALYPSFGGHTLESFIPFLAIGVPLGGVLLVLAFFVSAFAPQLVQDQKLDPFTAAFRSARAVKKHPLTMLLWASLLILSIGAGFATATLGFVVIMPVLSYASWHAYREVFADH